MLSQTWILNLKYAYGMLNPTRVGGGGGQFDPPSHIFQVTLERLFG